MSDGSSRGLLFDIDGVFFVGDTAIDGGADAITWANDARIPYLFVTNTTSHSRVHLADKLRGFGIDASPDEIVNPAIAAREWITRHDATPVALFVHDESLHEFDGLPITNDDDAASVVVGDLGEGWTFDVLNRALRLLMSQRRPPLISLGMSRYWLDSDGLKLDVGPFAQALAFATDNTPVITGKPEAAFFAAAAARLGISSSDVVMVGDDVRSDVGGAQAAGMRGVLIRTGKFDHSDLEVGVTPDAVIDSIADLPTWWQAQISP